MNTQKFDEWIVKNRSQEWDIEWEITIAKEEEEKSDNRNHQKLQSYRLMKSLDQLFSCGTISQRSHDFCLAQNFFISREIS
jgi:hypothetical protein